MPESLKDNVALFPPGKQRRFLEAAEKTLSVDRIAALCACSTRTVRDWRREKFPMRYDALTQLCTTLHLPIPKVTLRNRYAHTKAAGLAGAEAVLKKYGRIPVNEELRKRRRQEWWDKTGATTTSFGTYVKAKSILKPRKSVALAEFIGIMMGDGGIQPYQAIITLHHVDDRAYSEFVVQLVVSLFGIQPGVYHLPSRSVRTVVISRIEAVKYLCSLGLSIGNKVQQEFDIPDWIASKRSFSIACIRGLVDTDGTVFTHKYHVRNKSYSYKKLSFCSHSEPLRLSVAKILTDLGMHPRIAKYDVCLDSVADVSRYFAIIGSHNEKHLKRYTK